MHANDNELVIQFEGWFEQGAAKTAEPDDDRPRPAMPRPIALDNRGWVITAAEMQDLREALV